MKKKPGKNDIDQLNKFLTNKGIRKIYVYVDHPAKPFEKEIEKHSKDEIDFWDWNKLHNELIQAPSTQYLIRCLLQNPLIESLFSVHYDLYNCRKAKYIKHETSHEELSDLWNIKDDTVKLRAILDHIHRRWGEILSRKPLRGNLESNSYQNAYLISPFLGSYASPWNLRRSIYSSTYSLSIPLPAASEMTFSILAPLPF